MAHLHATTADKLLIIACMLHSHSLHIADEWESLGGCLHYQSQTSGQTRFYDELKVFLGLLADFNGRQKDENGLQDNSAFR